MKKFVLIAISFLLPAVCFAQQITKFGVVDTSKVYQAYFRNSAPVRNYETKKAEFQTEIDKQVDDIQKLHDQMLERKKNGDDAGALKLEAQITKKTDFLNEYTNAKNTELESLKRSLQDNDAFYKKLYDTLARVAETGGYSMILSLQEANAILWHSPSVDITEQVISQLGL